MVKISRAKERAGAKTEKNCVMYSPEGGGM